MLMYVGMKGQLHASWNPFIDKSKDFGYTEFVSDFSVLLVRRRTYL